MDEKNLDIYGNDAISWSRPLGELEQFESGPNASTWLATTNPDGRPHLTGVGALWHEGRFYVVSGPETRKSRNLAANASCAISLSLPTIDLVIEGTARRVTDVATLERLAQRYRDQGWEATVEGDAFTAPYSAPSAGTPPWYLYEIQPETAYGVATKEPYGATRWRLGTES